MSEELVMPRLSDTMEEGTIGRWLVHEGDSFSEGDVLAEIETDKATMEFQAYDAGTLLKILVDDGQSAALGSPIAIVGDAGESVAERPSTPLDTDEQPAADAEQKPTAKRTKPAAKPAAAASNGSSGGTAALKVSPIARRMADQAGIDLSELAGRGSGPEGRVVKADVERLMDGDRSSAPAQSAATPPAAATAADSELRELTPMLKAVAARMAQSKQTVPHFYVESEIDMTRAMQLRAGICHGKIPDCVRARYRLILE